MYLGNSLTVPNIVNLPGQGGGGSAFEYTAIDNSFSMLFDGAASYYNVNSLISGLSGQGAGTISMWWKPVDATPLQSTHYFTVSSTTVTNDYFSMGNLSNGKFYAQLKDNNNNQWVLETDAIAFSDNTWSHVVLTQNGTEPEVYINGVKPAQSFSVDVNRNRWWNYITIEQINIGAIIWSGGTATRTEGKIDELAVWTSALSEETIQAIYDTTANNPGKVADLSETPEGQPTAWYRMGD